ncbi:hypothetical protein [Thermomonas sp.]|uniref:hypothetical protein n=1 Tax=Thermomonas sp. TaxID=1971895 RepID=UPI0024881948|nr:hypothetical protein [Thermomonas sp.]MDI1253986.1 hypothetical protein [Thermomonas sp.]
MPFISVLLAATALTSTVAGVPPGNEAEEAYLEKLVMCQESWFSWKDDDRRMSQYLARFDANFTRSEDEPAFLPKGPANILGFPLIKVYPQSVGMGLGFSVQLGGQFAKIRSEVENKLGKPFECSASDGMTSCGAELGKNKSLTLTAFGNGANAINLIGCFYNYEK